MAGRGPQTFKKKQKEQQRKEKRQEKLARKMERKRQGPTDPSVSDDQEPLSDDQEGVAGPLDTEPLTTGE